MNSTDLIRGTLSVTLLLISSQIDATDLEKSTNSSVFDPFTSALLADDPIIPLVVDNGTLTVGRLPNHCIAGVSVLYGFAAGSIGSYSPTGLRGRETVDEAADVTAGGCVGAHSVLDVTGFSSNPGASWLNSITCNGVKNLGSSATFIYSSGAANWQWTQFFGLSSKVGTNVSCVIDHN